MKCLKAVKAHGLTPALGTVQSWYEHPVKDLPEDRPHTFMHLAKEFIEENGRTVSEAEQAGEGSQRWGSAKKARRSRTAN